MFLNNGITEYTSMITCSIIHFNKIYFNKRQTFNYMNKRLTFNYMNVIFVVYIFCHNVSCILIPFLIVFIANILDEIIYFWIVFNLLFVSLL